MQRKMFKKCCTKYKTNRPIKYDRRQDRTLAQRLRLQFAQANPTNETFSRIYREIVRAGQLVQNPARSTNHGNSTTNEVPAEMPNTTVRIIIRTHDVPPDDNNGSSDSADEEEYREYLEFCDRDEF